MAAYMQGGTLGRRFKSYGRLNPNACHARDVLRWDAEGME